MQAHSNAVISISEQLNPNFGTMSQFGKFCLVVVGLCSFASCNLNPCGQNKEVFLNKYEKLIEEVDHLDLDASDKAWNQYDERFRMYIEECYDLHENELSTKEKRRFWMKSLKYYTIRFGEGMINELSKEDAISEKVKKNLEDVLEVTGRDLEDLVGKNLQQLENLMRDVGKDIEDWASKLKEIFEE